MVTFRVFFFFFSKINCNCNILMFFLLFATMMFILCHNLNDIFIGLVFHIQRLAANTKRTQHYNIHIITNNLISTAPFSLPYHGVIFFFRKFQIDFFLLFTANLEIQYVLILICTSNVRRNKMKIY